MSANSKEVAKYADALKFGFDKLNESEGLITNNTLIGMFQILKETDAGYRVTPGTALKNKNDGSIVYVPPQDANNIAHHMGEMEEFINSSESSSLDPLVKMALIHHQFESIQRWEWPNWPDTQCLVFNSTRAVGNTGIIPQPHYTQNKVA